MALSDVTDPDAVRRALHEFDDLGRDQFLAKYGFAKSRSYFLIADGRAYDSKAIVGAAMPPIAAMAWCLIGVPI